MRKHGGSMVVGVTHAGGRAGAAERFKCEPFHLAYSVCYGVLAQRRRKGRAFMHL